MNFCITCFRKWRSLCKYNATTAVRSRVFKEKAHPRIRVGFHPRIRVGFKKERTNWLEFKFELDSIPEREIREVLALLLKKNGSIIVCAAGLFYLLKRESSKKFSDSFVLLRFKMKTWKAVFISQLFVAFNLWIR